LHRTLLSLEQPYRFTAMSEFIQIVTTTVSAEEARRIAAALVEQRLAGCVQIAGPIESIYRWQGKVERAQEWQLWIKTRSSLFTEVESAIRTLHSYDVPEVLALAVLDGSEPYLSWLRTETDTSVVTNEERRDKR
jgi:periplasmic divalent cation tolerance protein